MASILINSTPSLKRINENGIKKMCRNIFAIQQNLTNITMSREADLDHARQYYEIMYQTVRAEKTRYMYMYFWFISFLLVTYASYLGGKSKWQVQA